MASLKPKKRPDSPDEKYDLETGIKVLKPLPVKPIEVVVHTPLPTSMPKPQLTGEQILSKAIGPGAVASYKAGRKSRKQKKSLKKKTQKRRARK